MSGWHRWPCSLKIILSLHCLQPPLTPLSNRNGPTLQPLLKWILCYNPGPLTYTHILPLYIVIHSNRSSARFELAHCVNLLPLKKGFLLHCNPHLWKHRSPAILQFDSMTDAQWVEVSPNPGIIYYARMCGCPLIGGWTFQRNYFTFSEFNSPLSLFHFIRQCIGNWGAKTTIIQKPTALGARDQREAFFNFRDENENFSYSISHIETRMRIFVT